jgi:hypothetical protein
MLAAEKLRRSITMRNAGRSDRFGVFHDFLMSLIGLGSVNRHDEWRVLRRFVVVKVSVDGLARGRTTCSHDETMRRLQQYLSFRVVIVRVLGSRKRHVDRRRVKPFESGLRNVRVVEFVG